MKTKLKSKGPLGAAICSPLLVEARPMLVAGMLTVHKTTGQVIIRVDNHIIRKSEWAHTLWHETIHLLRMAGNFSQDEEDVERYAAILAAACPEIVEWVGLSQGNAEPIRGRQRKSQ